MRYLKQSTAATVTLGPFVDDTDAKTPETTLTIAQSNVRVRKNGGAAAAKNETTSCTHNEYGHYACPLDIVDTGTLGHLRIAVNATGALPVWEDFTVIPANVYDSLIGGTDNLVVDVEEIGTDVVSANAVASGAVSKVVTGILAGIFEGTKSLTDYLRLTFSVLCGKSTGGGTGTDTFRDVADTKARVTATVDVNGNRSAITLDAS